MKFVCESCSARYRIDDARVRGKILKIRCKRCGHVMEVSAPIAPAEPRPPSGAPASAMEWHVSINGASDGPYREAEVLERFRSGEVGDEAYVWNETYEDWKPASEVPAFRAALHAAKEAGKRDHAPATQQLSASDVDASLAGSATPGGGDLKARVSERLAALRETLESNDPPEPPSASETAESVEDELDPSDLLEMDAATAPAERETKPSTPVFDEPALDETPVVAEPDDETPILETAEEAVSAEDEDEAETTAQLSEDAMARVETLKRSLGGGDDDETVALERGELPTPEDDAADGAPAPGADDEETAPTTASEEVTKAPTEPTTEPDEGAAAAAASATAEAPAPAAEPGDANHDEPAAAGASPARDERPSVAALAAASVPPPRGGVSAMGAGASQSGLEPSASLLFQVQQAKKQRNRAIAASAVIILLLGGLLLFQSSRPDAPAEVATPEPAAQEPAEPVRIAPEDLTAAQRQALEANGRVARMHATRTVDRALGSARGSLPVAEVIAEDDGTAAVAAVSGRPTAGSSPRIGAVPQVQVPSANAGRGQSSSRNGGRRASLGSSSSASMTGSGGAEERAAIGSTEIEGDHGFYGRVGGTGSQAMPDLDAPELQNRGGARPTAAHFRDGLSSFVSDSVNRCTQRQIMQEGDMPQGRILLNLRVQPDGSVSRVRVDRAMRDSSFDRCLQSQRERWQFPPFGGDAMDLERTYLVQ